MTFVPCNGCKACCKNQRIILEQDEDKEAYITEPTRKGNDGKVEYMLAHKTNGDCIYLGDTGCTIHKRTPRACREFDCRVWYQGFDPEQRKALLASPLDSECARAAISRLT